VCDPFVVKRWCAAVHIGIRKAGMHACARAAQHRTRKRAQQYPCRSCHAAISSQFPNACIAGPPLCMHLLARSLSLTRAHTHTLTPTAHHTQASRSAHSLAVSPQRYGIARHVLQQQLMIDTHIAICLFMYEAVVVRQ
jgi:hypothetical protein